jgi:cell wall-associated NlpC family hydrolase
MRPAANFHILLQIAKMDIAVCVVPVSPMRKESAHRSEMVSELLFGEAAEVLEKSKEFTRVRGLHDGYEGWCQSGQLTIIDNPQRTWHKQLSREWVSVISCNDQPMHLSMGSSLDMFADGIAEVGKLRFRYEGSAWDPSLQVFDPGIMEMIAMQYLNTPYRWGGRSVFGIDCSGFVQQLFRFFNILLPRDACQQVEKGEVVGFLQEARKADLAFFDNEEGRIIHVGLLLSADTIIHSSGKVRIDSIDSRGIVNSDTGERTHTLRIVKRVMPSVK